ncbi:MAG: hypothetical protein ACE15C_13400 [Phycisphaerae bacterium]
MRSVLPVCAFVLAALAACALGQVGQGSTGPQAGQAAAPKTDIGQLLDGLSDKELGELVARAAQRRLSAELAQAADEIRDSLLFDQKQKDAAIKLLEAPAAPTMKDNIDRIARAFAAAKDDFAKARALHAAGDYSRAAEELRKLSVTGESGYYGACKAHLLADALYRAAVADVGSAGAEKDLAARQGVWRAIDAWQELLEAMPDKVSFSATAALSCAEAYEKLGRGLYALRMYRFILVNFSIVLEGEQVETMAGRAQELADVYADPLASAGKWMGQVSKRLDDIDSGAATQKRENEIVALLEDLIKNIEEQPQPPGPRGGGRGGGSPGGIGGPAGESTIPGGGGRRTPGGVERPDNATDRPLVRAAQRQKLVEMGRRIMSERHRDIIRDYFLRLAEQRRNQDR